MIQLLQICTDYATLPDLNSITIDDIRFFYNPIIDKLIDYQQKSEANGQ